MLTTLCWLLVCMPSSVPPNTHSLLLSAGDYSKASTAQYQRRWMKAYGHDFPMSTKFAELIYRCVT